MNLVPETSNEIPSAVEPADVWVLLEGEPNEGFHLMGVYSTEARARAASVEAGIGIAGYHWHVAKRMSVDAPVDDDDWDDGVEVNR